MRAYFKLLILFFLAWTIQPFSYGQETDFGHIRSVADSVYGLNDLLINGRIYTDLHSQANGHPFFPEAYSTKGAVYIKGEKFDDIKINYSAEMDELVLDVGESMPWIKYIGLNNKLVDSFLITDRKFINVQTLSVGSADQIYLEKLYEGKFYLFAQHQKSFKPEFNHWNPKGIFIAKPTNYLLLKNGTFYDMTHKKQWLNYFSDHKKELKRFLNKNKVNLRKAHIEQLKQVAAFCNDLS